MSRHDPTEIMTTEEYLASLAVNAREITPELRASHTANRAAISAARRCPNPRTCACQDCADQRWQDKRDEEFDDRWNARMNP